MNYARGIIWFKDLLEDQLRERFERFSNPDLELSLFLGHGVFYAHEEFGGVGLLLDGRVSDTISPENLWELLCQQADADVQTRDFSINHNGSCEKIHTRATENNYMGIRYPQRFIEHGEELVDKLQRIPQLGDLALRAVEPFSQYRPYPGTRMCDIEAGQSVPPDYEHHAKRARASDALNDEFLICVDLTVTDKGRRKIKDAVVAANETIPYLRIDYMLDLEQM